MQKLIELSNKEKRVVIGLMSGTSLDGVDAVLVEIERKGNNPKPSIKQLGFIEYPFPEGFKELVLKNSVSEGSSVEDICRLNFLIPRIYFDAIKELLRITGYDLSHVDLIGSHGQTIHHLPAESDMFGYKIRSTLQIGDPSVIAKLTGVITVGDFRTGDVALGGQGAPLVPYFDHILFHSDKDSRALLNIGGISNFSILRHDARKGEVYAFDTGPGNMMIDIMAKRFFDVPFDKNGEMASKGKVNGELLESLIKMDNYIEAPPPKSTGRELYGENFLMPILKEFSSLSPFDWMATLTSFTAYGVFRSYEKFIMPITRISQLIVSGGGAKNSFLMNELKAYFGHSVEVMNIDSLGLEGDAKEAICFALLANETISGIPANIPEVTGAEKETILGKICLP